MELSFPAFAHRVTVFGSTRNAAATSAGVSRALAMFEACVAVIDCLLLLEHLSFGRSMAALVATGLRRRPVRPARIASNRGHGNAQGAGDPVDRRGPRAAFLSLDIGQRGLAHPHLAGEFRLVPAVFLPEAPDRRTVLPRGSFPRSDIAARL